MIIRAISATTEFVLYRFVCILGAMDIIALKEIAWLLKGRTLYGGLTVSFIWLYYHVFCIDIFVITYLYHSSVLLFIDTCFLH